MTNTSIQSGARGRRKSGTMHAALLLQLCAFVAGLVLATQVASADPAREHFEKGRKLLKQGKAKAACEAFQKSIEIAPTNVGVFLNLGDCNQKQQKFASAVAAFTEASRLAAEKKDTTRMILAEQRLAAVASRLSTIKVLMPAELSSQNEVAVLVDGQPVAAAAVNAPIPVDIGKHAIVVNVGGEEYFTKDVEVLSEKQIVTVEVPTNNGGERTNVGAESKNGELGITAPGSEPKSGTSPIVWSLLGAAVVSAGVGTYLGLDALSKWNEAEACNKTQCTQADADLAASARLRGHFSTGLFVVSAATLGIGVWLYFRGRSSSEQEGVSREPVVVVGPTSIGVLGRF